MKSARGRRRSIATVTKKECNGHLVGEIRSFLHASHPGCGVDALVVQPTAAMRLCADVARAVGKINAAEWNAFTVALGVFEMQHGDLLRVINGICRAMMNGRKQGLLKPSGTSPAIRAAQTRKDRNKKGRQ